MHVSKEKYEIHTYMHGVPRGFEDQIPIVVGEEKERKELGGVEWRVGSATE